MKKILITLLTIFMLVPIVGTFDSKEVKALGQNEMACGAFEVDYINDDGSFTSVGCYDDLASAKSTMKSLGGDHVVRHAKSLSYTKIVAMNSGIVYSYPRWGATINIYQDPEIRSIYYKTTYVSRHYEMKYIETERANVGRSGYTYGMVEVNVMGFHGYCDLENVDLVPSKYIRNGISITLGGNNTYTGENFFSIVPKQNYFEVKDNGGVKELVFHMYYGYGTNGSPESYSFTIGKAADSMNVGTNYYSYDGYNFYTNSDYSGTCITYYNYYQFLPLRSKSTVTAEILNSYISGYPDSAMLNSGQAFIDAQEKYGINALILFSMAIHESGYGRSGYAKNRNNLFGWSAYDADPNSATYFSSVYNCVLEQAGINLRGFVDITDGRFFSSSLGNKGSGLNVKYASDPYWGMKIASYCYAIDKNYNSSKDLNAYTLSLINTFDIPVKASASDSSNTLYTTQYGPYYQENFIVINLGDAGNGYTKIQSTNPIDASGNIQTHRTPITTGNLNPISYGEYDWDRSVGYVNTSYLSALNSSNGGNVSPTPSVDPVTPVEKTIKLTTKNITIENNVINISGYAFIQGIDFTDLSKITHTINLVSTIDDSIVASYTATTSEYSGLYFNDGYTYNYIGFSANINFDDLISKSDYEGGEYYLTITIKNGDTIMSTNLYSVNDAHTNINSTIGSFNCRVYANSVYQNRIEVSLAHLPSVINYSEIKKTSTRESLFSYNDLSLDSDGKFYIKGNAMIYYMNYASAEATKYTLYLVDDANNYKEIPCTTLRSSFDYQSILNSSYNMDYISFEANADLSDLANGYYMMILKIENGGNIDYLELRNTAGKTIVSNTTYRLFTSTIRDRLMIQINK